MRTIGRLWSRILVILVLLAQCAGAQVCGDCDGDGDVDITDALRAAIITFGHTSQTVAERLRCDADGSGRVTVLDALMLAQIAAGLPVVSACLSPRQWQLVRESGLGGANVRTAAMVYDAARAEMMIVVNWNFPVGTRTFVRSGGEWVERAIGTTVPARAMPMVYDSNRQLVVMPDLNAGRIWTWDGVAWQFLFALGPPPRFTSAVAFDSTRGVVVVHGGYISSGPPQDFEDTWEWDGVAWREVVAAIVPPTSAFARMAFDPIRAKIVLFGGTIPPGPETYEYDGIDWSISSAPPLSQLQGTPNLHFDPISSRILMSGANSTGDMSVFSYDGMAWSALASSTPPSPRIHEFVAQDSSTGHLMLFGGRSISSGCISGETWEWDGAAWLRIDELEDPPTFFDMGMAHHRSSAQTLIGGGEFDGGCESNTGIWDGSTWTFLPATAPEIFRGSICSMAYDSLRDVTVLIGRAAVSGRFEVWEWDSASWRRIFHPTEPTGEFVGQIAFDEARGQLIHVRSTRLPLAVFRIDTWTFNGVDFQLLEANSPLPPELEGWAMAYHPPTQKVVLHGGTSPYLSPANPDTYTWDGNTWTLADLDFAPPAITYGQMTYDATHKSLVLVGRRFGSLLPPETWEWDGARWAQATTPISPFQNSSMGMTYDDARDVIVFYGGRGAYPERLSIELWEYR